MNTSNSRTGWFVAIGVAAVAVVGVGLWLLALGTTRDQSDQIDRLTSEITATQTERDELVSQVSDAESDAANNASRWLAAVAVSGTYPPAQSRLLAVEASTRSPTTESAAALGQLLFADPRVQPPTVELEHEGPVWATAASSTGDLVVTGSHDSTAKIWSSNGELLATLTSPDRVQTMDLSADDRFVATGSLDGTATAWTADGEQVARSTHEDQVNDIAISSTGALMVSGGHDNVVIVTDTAADEIRQRLAHPDRVWTVAISPDDRQAATGGQDGTARVWDLETGDEVATYEMGQPVATLDFSPDGRWLFAGDQGGHAILVNAKTGEDTPPLDGAFRGGILDVDWHPDGTEFALVSLGGIHRYDLSTQDLVAEHQVAGGSRGVAYGPTGDWFVTASGDFQFSFGQVIYWDTATGSQLVSLNLGGPAENIAVQSTGTVITGFRMTEDLIETGGAWLTPGPDAWAQLACAGTDGVISEQTWRELTGETSTRQTNCP